MVSGSGQNRVVKEWRTLCSSLRWGGDGVVLVLLLLQCVLHIIHVYDDWIGEGKFFRLEDLVDGIWVECVVFRSVYRFGGEGYKVVRAEALLSGD